MQALILAAILNYPVSPLCSQWLERMDSESRQVARLVWSPQKQRHLKRLDQAIQKSRLHCVEEQVQDDSVASSVHQGTPNAVAIGF